MVALNPTWFEAAFSALKCFEVFKSFDSIYAYAEELNGFRIINSIDLEYLYVQNGHFQHGDLFIYLSLLSCEP